MPNAGMTFSVMSYALRTSGPPYRRTFLWRRFFLGYLHSLLECNVFDDIELHFGLKGHTHGGEDLATHDVHLGRLVDLVTCTTYDSYRRLPKLEWNVQWL